MKRATKTLSLGEKSVKVKGRENKKETFDCLFDQLTDWLTEALRSWRASFVLPVATLYWAAER